MKINIGGLMYQTIRRHILDDSTVLVTAEGMSEKQKARGWSPLQDAALHSLYTSSDMRVMKYTLSRMRWGNHIACMGGMIYLQDLDVKIEAASHFFILKRKNHIQEYTKMAYTLPI
jgi:hypothetical protein